MKVPGHVTSPSVQLGLSIGLLMYVCYGWAYEAFGNGSLIALCSFVAVFIPYYSKLSNRVEEYLNLRTAIVTLGRVGRFIPQFGFNYIVFRVFIDGHVVPVANVEALGGVAGVALLTTLASQGMQYIAVAFANRERGDKNRNVLIALSTNIVVTAIATLGHDWVKSVFLVGGLTFGSFFFAIGLLSDLRGRFFRRGGVGIFFGTFNPIHTTHLALIRDAIASRRLDKVYIHSTVIPKLHAQALEREEIRIARHEHGMRVYEKTARADVHLNYFPTGSRFYEYETRLAMMRVAIEEAGLGGKVEVLSLPEAYARGGFYSILAHIKVLASGRPIHGIHGSDLGGMWVRGIYDEAGWIYPYPVVRRDKVSATAIRNGCAGMTTDTVQAMIESLRNTAPGLSRQGASA
jgi:nicotinic acid mononucleotide adenylyltransferase